MKSFNIKTIVLLLNLIFICYCSVGQNFKKIDEHAKEAPASVARDVESLAKYLSKPAKSELEKIRAFYIWITHNIDYDIQAFLNMKLEINNSSNVFLKRKKGVCQDYANLLKELCDATGVKCYMISGYSKGFGFDAKKSFGVPDHSWNAVSIDNKWFLIDATWGSGYVNEKTKFIRSFKEDFFLGNPKKVILTHLPIDPMWQLLDCPISINDFGKDSLQIKKIVSGSKKCFDFEDSIANFEKLTKEEQNLKTAINSYLYNPKNNLNIGLAYLNYGANKSQILISKQKELKPEELLKGMEENLGYYKTAKQYLLKVEGVKGNELMSICNQNIKNTQSNIKQIKGFLEK